MTKLLTYLLLLATLIAAIGCGGSSGSAAPSDRSVSLFITDDFRTDYDQAWGTLYRLELIADDSTTTTVYDNADGRRFDFNSLRDGSGAKYLFLNVANVRNANYRSARVTLGDKMTLFPTGVTTGTEATVQGTAAGTGKVSVTFNLPTMVRFEDDDDFVLDFDMPNFTVVAGNVVPSLKQGGRSGLDDINRHEPDDVHGTVSGLSGTAPNLMFDITLANGRSLRVRTSSTTEIFNSNGTPNPVLSVGKRVEVYGAFDTTANEYIARRVKIEDGQGGGNDDDNHFRGVASEGNVETGLFTYAVRFSPDFILPSNLVTVETTANTIYRNDNGLIITKAEFFTAISTPGTIVEVEGLWNATSQKLVAKKVKLENEDDDGPQSVEAKGNIVTENPAGGSLTMSVSEYEGWSFGGGVLSVTTTGNTVFQADNNDPLTKEQFFAATAAGTEIKVNGRLTANGVEATRIRLED